MGVRSSELGLIKNGHLKVQYLKVTILNQEYTIKREGECPTPYPPVWQLL